MITSPWERQPPNPIYEFDPENFYGSHCIWALVPGWFPLEGVAGAAGTGTAVSVGQRFEYDLELVANTDDYAVVIRNYGRGIGAVRAGLVDSANTSSYKLKRTDGDVGIVFPNLSSTTILGICVPNSAIGGGDGRLYSKDTGSGADDHDMMIGVVSSVTVARARIRVNATTSITVTTGTIQQDALNLISASVINPSGDVALHLLREDGVHSRTLNTDGSTPYNPRTTTNTAIHGNADATGNSLAGAVICVCAFDIALDSEVHMRNIMANPWQIFAPEVLYFKPPAVGGATFPHGPFGHPLHGPMAGPVGP